MTEQSPRFVNLQRGAVSVLDKQGRQVLVHPWEHRGHYADAVHVVEGEWYSQFCGPMQQLAPFPDGDAIPAGVTRDDGSQVLAGEFADDPVPDSPPDTTAPSAVTVQARRGRFRATGDLIRGGRVVAPEQMNVEDVKTSQAALAEALGEMWVAPLARLGIFTVRQLMDAPQAVLLTLPGATPAGVAELRESVVAFLDRVPETPSGRVSGPAVVVEEGPVVASKHATPKRAAPKRAKKKSKKKASRKVPKPEAD